MRLRYRGRVPATRRAADFTVGRRRVRRARRFTPGLVTWRQLAGPWGRSASGASRGLQGGAAWLLGGTHLPRPFWRARRALDTDLAGGRLGRLGDAPASRTGAVRAAPVPEGSLQRFGTRHRGGVPRRCIARNIARGQALWPVRVRSLLASSTADPAGRPTRPRLHLILRRDTARAFAGHPRRGLHEERSSTTGNLTLPGPRHRPPRTRVVMSPSLPRTSAPRPSERRTDCRRWGCRGPRCSRAARPWASLVPVVSGCPDCWASPAQLCARVPTRPPSSSRLLHNFISHVLAAGTEFKGYTGAPSTSTVMLVRLLTATPTPLAGSWRRPRWFQGGGRRPRFSGAEAPGTSSPRSGAHRPCYKLQRS